MMLMKPTRGSQMRPVFDELFRMPDLWEEMGQRLRGAAADVYETAEAVIVEMAIPGVKPEDIAINVTGDTLTISGESKQEEKKEKRNYYQQELRYGSFAQSVVLPASVQADKAEAHFQHGMLKITLPKAEEAKPKQIKVQVK